ncbi:hypothetical protein [Niabella hibiscisoli]|nr:hypothetical protein [Niabella hibiscisoli]MCH5717185.1 hypothetical protein [Niabella hibiscisoli]
MKTKLFYIQAIALISMLSVSVLSGCTKDFLKPDPLSFMNPILHLLIVQA